MRSSPNPNAKPEYSSGSMSTASSTLGSTMPHPPSWIQPVREHTLHPELHRRSVRSPPHLLGPAQLHVERVPRGARGMGGRHVESLEVVPVGLDLGTFGDLEAEPHEHVFELTLHLRDHVEVPTTAT